MSDPVKIAIITGIVSTAGSLIAAAFAFLALRYTKETHKAVNSRLDLFMVTSEKLFHAQGVLQEKSDEQERKDKGNPPL